MGRVVIGMDPHKRSATIEVIDDREKVLARGRYGTDSVGYQEMLAAGRRFTDRVWAIEGCGGIGRHIAQRLVADGEPVLDVPAKLSARVRVFDTGQGRKTDPVDAHSVAVAGLRSPSLRQVTADDATVVLRLLVDRRDELGRTRTETVSRIHHLLLELIPGGAKKFLTRGQASYLLRTAPPPVGIVAQTRHDLARELIEELTTIDAKIRAADKQLRQLVAAYGSSLTDLYGIGPSGAARLLGDIGDIRRFRTAAHFASWNGTAPLEASSGDQRRHRLSRVGNRRINRVLHIMAIVQLRRDTPGRAYYRRRLAEGKTTMEALRALKRHLSDVVFKRMLRDAAPQRTAGTGPGGHTGATLQSSADDPIPTAISSDKSQPGPADNKPKTTSPQPLD
ncbi:Transposase [Micromonospora rhizosphaerae]|uniref:Transposase n=1 Tax=Micromonospora rhizosphaerae TaxID=568872 RepID=A0A1C6SGW6_9ACTN|nr:IS110 family transposase [Micromonospora rhizosphaerae]SCL28588.1 Transposase [Micromonospora rhizosphaerae]